MQVDVINRPEVLHGLKDNWIDLYARDEEAQYFLSWAFMSTFLRRFDGSWFVLAARRGPCGSPYDAFLPLRLRTRMNLESGFFHNEINMGGSYTADYTGIVCAPGLADQAFAAGFLFFLVTVLLAAPGGAILLWEGVRGGARPRVEHG